MKLVTGSEKMDAGALMEYFKPLIDYLKVQNGNDFGWDPQCPPNMFNSAEPAEVRQFLSDYDSAASIRRYTDAEAAWTYESNITDHNEKLMVSDWGWVTRFGTNMGQIGPKWYKSGTFQIRFQYILAQLRQNVLKSDLNKSGSFWVQIWSSRCDI